MSRTSTGLSRRTAAALAHSGWWVTGALMLLVERRDPFVRAHARQSVAVFGAISVLIVIFGLIAVASLAVATTGFALFTIAAALTWLAGVLLWGSAMWCAANGEPWTVGARVLALLRAAVPGRRFTRSPAPEPPLLD